MPVPSRFAALGEPLVRAGLDPDRVARGLGSAAIAPPGAQDPARRWDLLFRAADRTRGAEGTRALLQRAWQEKPGSPEVLAVAGRLARVSRAPRRSSTGLFLSYATPDRKQVDALYEGLVTAGFEVFQDHRMPLGVRWYDHLRDHAGGAATMLCWLTDRYLQSVWGAYEVGYADRAGGRIVPIEPRALTVPVPDFLSGRQGIRPPFRVSRDLPKLVKRLKERSP